MGQWRAPLTSSASSPPPSAITRWAAGLEVFSLCTAVLLSPARPCPPSRRSLFAPVLCLSSYVPPPCPSVSIPSSPSFSRYPRSHLLLLPTCVCVWLCKSLYQSVQDSLLAYLGAKLLGEAPAGLGQSGHVLMRFGAGRRWRGSAWTPWCEPLYRLCGTASSCRFPAEGMKVMHPRGRPRRWEKLFTNPRFLFRLVTHMARLPSLLIFNSGFNSPPPP